MAIFGFFYTSQMYFISLDYAIILFIWNLMDANQKIRIITTNERLILRYVTPELISDPFRWSYVSQLLGVFMPGCEKTLCEIHHYKQLPFQLPGGIFAFYLHGLLFYLSLILGNSPLGPFVFPAKKCIPVFIGRWCLCSRYCTVVQFWRMKIAPADSAILFACAICVVLATIQLRTYANQITVHTCQHNL